MQFVDLSGIRMKNFQQKKKDKNFPEILFFSFLFFSRFPFSKTLKVYPCDKKNLIYQTICILDNNSYNKYVIPHIYLML